jgi:hypothetical protein
MNNKTEQILTVIFMVSLLTMVVSLMTSVLISSSILVIIGVTSMALTVLIMGYMMIKS